MTLVSGLIQTIEEQFRDQNPYLIKNKESVKTLLLKINKNLIDMRQDFYQRVKEIEINDIKYQVLAGANVLEFLKENEYTGLDDPDAIIIANGTMINNLTTFSDIRGISIKIKCFTPKVSKGTCHVVIKTLSGKSFLIYLEPSDTIEDLKCCIESSQKIPFDQIRLISCGKQLENDRTCADYFTSYPPTINLVLRLRGGMFHITSGMNDYEALTKHMESYELDEAFMNKLRTEYDGQIYKLNESINSIIRLISRF